MHMMMNIYSPVLLWINAKIAAMLSSEYTLIVLDDEDVPLASGVKTNTLWTVVICAVCFVLLLAFLYAARRNRLIKRLSVLRKQNNVSSSDYPFSLSKIEEEILELENEIASAIGVEA